MNNKMKDGKADSVKVLSGFPPHLELEGALEKENSHLIFLGIHMKPECNFKCKKCFIGKLSNLRNAKQPLDLAEIERIMVNARKSGVKVFGLTGAGEPLMDSKIMEVISIANRLGFITHLATNGSLLTEEKLKFLRDNNVTLVISFDTLNPKMFAELAGTSEAVFEMVKANILKAQDIFRGTKETKEICGKKVEVFRLAIHSTMSNINIDQMQELKEFVDPDVTLFSASPVAEVQQAKKNRLNVLEELNKELSEKHIVAVKHPSTGKPICGFFFFGIDINFDGEILLDAHQIDSRNLIANIRDFNFDVKKAFLATKQIKEDFIARFIKGFCPVRSPKVKDFLREKARDKKIHKKIVGSLKKGECLLKFAYLKDGARRFIAVLRSPEYTTGRIEKELIKMNADGIKKFVDSRNMVVLGAGDGEKIDSIINGNKSVDIIDLSTDMMEFCQKTLKRKREADFREMDFEKIDFNRFGKSPVFVMFGNTLGNMDDVCGFLKKISSVKSARLVLGIELLKDRSAETIEKIFKEYNNEAGFQFIFTPLELIGLRRSDGIIRVDFNEEQSRIEEFFECRNERAAMLLAEKTGLRAEPLEDILLSISSKMTEPQFSTILQEAGLKIIDIFNEGTNFIFLLEQNAQGRLQGQGIRHDR